jgi:hypothetical protein
MADGGQQHFTAAKDSVMGGRAIPNSSGNHRWRRCVYSPASALLMMALLASPARAARLAGVTLPDTATAGGTTLVLNGIGLRTYSVMEVHIYVAGLYLQTPSHDANAILASSGVKLLLLYFVRDVPADKVRDAWRTGLLSNCIAPCSLPPALLARFLSSLPEMHAGETVQLVFTKAGMHAFNDGKPAGSFDDPQFCRLLLAVFLGPHAAVPRLKAELLGAA